MTVMRPSGNRSLAPFCNPLAPPSCWAGVRVQGAGGARGADECAIRDHAGLMAGSPMRVAETFVIAGFRTYFI